MFVDVESPLQSDQTSNMNKYLGLAILVVCLANVLTQEDGEEDGEEEEEEEESWSRQRVVPGLLVHIHNPALNCSLTMLDQRYPPVYPDGRVSSQQLVVGCVPTVEGEDHLNPRYLWQIQHSQPEVSPHHQ